jgi:subtilisin-like proprotein convertase family protein
MKPKLNYVLTAITFLMVFTLAAQDNIFKEIAHHNKSQKSISTSKKDISYTFDYTYFSNCLTKAKQVTSGTRSNGLLISFPNAKGQLERYRIMESSVMQGNLQTKYSNIRSYVGYGVDVPSHYLRFSLSPYNGLSGIIIGDGSTTVIEPYSGHSNQFKVMRSDSIEKQTQLTCNTPLSTSAKSQKSLTGKGNVNSNIKRTFRIAVSVTGEYAQFHGGTLERVNAAIAASLTTVNAIFENDLNVTLQLIENNDAVIFLDSETDPYSDFSGAFSDELQAALRCNVGVENYDLGHLFAFSPGFNGNAGCIGCVCDDGPIISINCNVEEEQFGGNTFNNEAKDRGFSASENPIGFDFDINLLAHEIGHQFGANHTWTFMGNELTGVQIEPGSGSTIMGNAGISGSSNVTQNSDTYFHALSIQQIKDYMDTTNCAFVEDTDNIPPTVSAGDDLILPIGTPFRLNGVATDANGDNLTYCWEQIDDNAARNVFPDADLEDDNAVLFRSFPPTTDSTRYFPNLSDLKLGLNSGQWEKVPNVSRSANFRLTVRDNRPNDGNTSFDDVRVTFDENFGPFEITSQNAAGFSLVIGSTEFIRWNVNNTNLLPGAATVDILLSIDGGDTFSTIASSVPNNGLRAIEVPDTPSTDCRFMIAPSNNNSFFAMSPESFAIGLEVNQNCTRFNSEENLNLNIADGFGLTTNTITITDADVITDLNIGVDINHEFIGDLVITVTSPSGTELILKTENNCNNRRLDGNAIRGTFDDDGIDFDCFRSDENLTQRTPQDNSLSVFNGGNLNGNWTISIEDVFDGDTGTLNSWFIESCQPATGNALQANNDTFGNFVLFPNPIEDSGVFFLRAPSLHDSKNISIEIFDVRGKLIYEQRLPETNFLSSAITLRNAQSGLYFLNLSDGNNSFFRKFIVR